ncbi:hypothetical protein SAMN05444580_103366 [Rhodococcus tukisamuensis]|uniref:Transposase DDE domain-containing protein n=1 Tax=Rhodococcus tukisamuensis TaxID=168276 RepID=A0A1G6T1R3_9NOCA|nr:hypothetical protein SAMN05444580_103366 [Rhodococcus tukisamuensis]
MRQAQWPSVGLDAEKHKGRNVVERPFCTLMLWRALAARYDNSL